MGSAKSRGLRGNVITWGRELRESVGSWVTWVKYILMWVNFCFAWDNFYLLDEIILLYYN